MATTFSTTFNVSDVITKLADDQGLSVIVEGVDDICYGMVIASDVSFNDFCAQHATPYNFQIVDGDPIRIVRRPINDSLTIDHTLNQTDCVVRGGAAVSLKRVDVTNLPRQVEIQYLDPDRDFATTTQYARHPGAPTTNAGISFSLSFVISATDARALAFDTLYRIWSQQLALNFEHKDLTIEPGDTVEITCDQGVFTVLVQEATYTAARTTTVQGTVLLSSSGITVNAGVADQYVQNNTDIDTESWLLTVM